MKEKTHGRNVFCSAKKSNGDPCKKFAIKGASVCRTHGGAAPQVKRKAAERIEASKHRVLEEMCHLAFVDIRTAFDEDGNLLPIKQLPDRVAKALAGVEFEEIYGKGANGERVRIGRTAKIKMIDKNTTLNSIARHLGMFVDRTVTTIRDEMFTRMTNEELHRYAESGVLPPWFQAALAATSSNEGEGNGQ